MAGVDITDLTDFLIAEVNVPGGNAFPEATTADWEIRLMNAFWETVLDGLIRGYVMDDNGIVTPQTGSVELIREFQQLIIFYAGVTVVRNALRTLNASFRAKAGVVEYETTQAATVMKSILDELVRKRAIVLQRLSDIGQIATTYVDMNFWRDDSLRYGDTWWLTA